ncbi:hypothetical protein GGR53DRAFT_511418 [Hypoxylon sp. FL1150]|nr:hypothetical protein GGR53DRAFT_511418 [Hypoxylon sp. FL1150]
MTEVPVEKLTVPRYGERRDPQASMADVKARAADARTENVSFRIRMTPEFHEGLGTMYPERPEAVDLVRRRQFPSRVVAAERNRDRNRNLRRTNAACYSVSGDSRGSTLWGLKVRGCGLVQITPLYFQILVQTYLNWDCCNPSLFNSVADNQKKVNIVASVCEARGFSGIQIIEFITTGSGWNREENRLWNVRELVEKFDTTVLKRRKHLEQEFLAT